MVLQYGEKDKDTGIKYTDENVEKIAKEGRDERNALFNINQKKLRERVQGDEQTAMNKYGEAFCYGCARTDRAISTVFYVCPKCRHKKGTEGLYAIVKRKFAQELCDICGHWEFGVCQVNASLCTARCMPALHRIHRAYRAAGKAASHPYMKALQQKYGKDWMMYYNPARRVDEEAIMPRK